MAQFTQSDVLNELGRIFRGKLDPVREEGVADPAATHKQVLEIASLTFLTDPNAIYYLASLARNKVAAKVSEEISIVEDMLVALKDIKLANRSTTDVKKGTTDLVDARTAILSLDVVGTVENRPELVTFQKAIERFTNRFRPNVVSEDRKLIIPRGEARAQIRTNLILLKETHEELLDVLSSLAGLLTNYQILDLPTVTSRHALLNISNMLKDLGEEVATVDNETSITRSRAYLLKTMTAKSAVSLLQDFVVPQPGQYKLDSSGTGTALRGVVGLPSKSLSKGGPFYGEAFGTGIAPFVDSTSGPWSREALSTFLKVKIDGGAEQTIDLSGGLSEMHGRNPAPYTAAQLSPTWPGAGATTDPPPELQEHFTPKHEIYLNLDPRTYRFTIADWQAGLTPADQTTTVRLTPPVNLGFKHLGAPFTLLDINDWVIDDGTGPWPAPGNLVSQQTAPDVWASTAHRTRYTHLTTPRCITDLALLGVTNLTWISGDQYTSSTGGGANITIQPHHVGYYVLNPWFSTGLGRYEIIAVDGATVTLDMRGDMLPIAMFNVYGSRGDYTEITFSPSMLSHTERIWGATGLALANVTYNASTIGPAIKVGDLGTTTVASAAAAAANLSVIPTLSSTQSRSEAGHHVIFKEKFDGSGNIAMEGRTRMDPYMAVSDSFVQVRSDLQVGSGTNNDYAQYPGPYPTQIIQKSAHEVVGLRLGQQPSHHSYITAEDVASRISEVLTGATVAIVEDEIASGTATVNGATKTVTDAATDFGSLSLTFGYQLELQAGDNQGTYLISGPGVASTLTVERVQDFIGTELEVPYRLYSLKLRITSNNAGPLSSVEVTQTPTALAFSSVIQRGTVPSLQMLNKHGEALDLSGLLAGDYSDSYVVESVSADGTTVTLASQVSSDTTGLSLKFYGKTELALLQLLSELDTLSRSGTLLQQYGFDQDLSKLDTALIPVLTPGSTFASSLGEANLILASLLSILTASPRRFDEHEVSLPPAALNIETVLGSYSASASKGVDTLISGLEEHQYDRAIDLVTSGKIDEFFETTHETASYAGDFMSSAKTAASDLPADPMGVTAVENIISEGDLYPDEDAELNYSDTEDEELYDV